MVSSAGCSRGTVLFRRLFVCCRSPVQLCPVWLILICFHRCFFFWYFSMPCQTMVRCDPTDLRHSQQPFTTVKLITINTRLPRHTFERAPSETGVSLRQVGGREEKGQGEICSLPAHRHDGTSCQRPRPGDDGCISRPYPGQCLCCACLCLGCRRRVSLACLHRDVPVYPR